MKLPTALATSAFRAWLGGFLLTLVLVGLPLGDVLVHLRTPFPGAFYFTPIGVAIVALYAMTVRPRLFAASGVLLGLTPLVAWGILDGLLSCARFNRGGPNGGCEADPSAQVALAIAVYAAALLSTGAAVWTSHRA